MSTSALQVHVREMLEDADMPLDVMEAIAKLIGDAEDSRAERNYDRQQERLMEGGGGPTLREQQIAAMKLK